MKQSCICEIKDKKNWVVIHRNCNYSYFQYPKGGYHYSDYSLVRCMKCENIWRTKANYVSELKDGDFSDRISSSMSSSAKEGEK